MAEVTFTIDWDKERIRSSFMEDMFAENLRNAVHGAFRPHKIALKNIDIGTSKSSLECQAPDGMPFAEFVEKFKGHFPNGGKYKEIGEKIKLIVGKPLSVDL